MQGRSLPLLSLPFANLALRPLMKGDLRFFFSESALYESDEPPFYNADEIPEVRYILENYETIREEVSEYINGRFDVSSPLPSPPAMSGPKIWKNIYFKNYLLKYGLGKRYFPRTFQLFADRKEFTLAGIVSLAPGGRLMSHCGETNAVIRCHLGLKVPGKLPELGLKVKGESVSWEEGKVIAFNDAYQHEVWNDTNETRYLLGFDVIRPEFARYGTEICAYCLGIQAMQVLFKTIGVYELTPLWMRSLTTQPLALMAWILLKFSHLFA